MKTTDLIVSRFVQGIPLLFGLTLVVLVDLVMLPGNGARMIQSVHANPEMTEYLIEKWGLDQPVHVG
jgi:ABC-type dipeptide/oligopeptide/nickel transport system permease component